MTVPTDFDPAAIRLIGNVNGSPPFQGVLKHHGWRVKAVQLPLLPATRDDTSVLSPAEVEISEVESVAVGPRSQSAAT